MVTVGIRELAERASAVVANVERTGQPTLITRRGQPVAVLITVNEDDFYDYVLAHAPEYVRGMREAEAEIVSGVRGIPLNEALAEMSHHSA